MPSRSALLVLDNAEHLLDGVIEFVERVRREAPGVHILVTSQEVLRSHGEQVFRPEPLQLPVGDDPTAIDASAAVALFVARAKAASRHFVLDDGNRVAVAEICRRLDGIPLAIELAAARVPLLGVTGLRDRLDQRLQVLTGGQRTSLRRHQTLRAALEWSYQLLSRPEQVVLRRLSVFVGGFSLEAAQQVAEDEDDIDRWDVLEHLGGLVDKSLVMVEGDDVPRYRLLETTRLFGLERLIESGEAAAVRSLHLDHFLAVAEAAREHMLVADPRGLGKLDLERDNMMLALAWRPRDDDVSRALRLVSALRFYWSSRAMMARGLELALGVLDYARDRPSSPVKCQVLGELGYLHRATGNQQAARAAAHSAVAMARELGDPVLLSRMLASAGMAHVAAGESDRAFQCADEALALVAGRGDCSEVANALSLRSAALEGQGDLMQAVQVQEQVLAIRQRMRHAWSQAVAHVNIASTAIECAPHLVLPHLRRMVALVPQVDSEYIGICLMDTTATWAATQGRHEDCLTTEGAAAAQLRRLGITRPTDRRRAAWIQRARDAVGPAAAAAMEQRGAAWSYAAALARAVQLVADGAPEAGTPPSGSPAT